MKGQKLIALVASLLLGGAALAAPVNVNRADAATIASSLDGVGPLTARAIVAHREQHGPFRRKEDLLKVKGVGEQVLRRNYGDILLKD